MLAAAQPRYESNRGWCRNGFRRRELLQDVRHLLYRLTHYKRRCQAQNRRRYVARIALAPVMDVLPARQPVADDSRHSRNR